VHHDITVNCVTPGAIETEAYRAHNPMPPGFRESGSTDREFFEEMARMAAGGWSASAGPPDRGRRGGK
jgi:NAD(P)-dependent dehydrogenase (short-subunit alcohol dehydrogenase family)